MRKFTLHLLASVALSLAAGAADADIVSYQVSNATFNDGVMMSGTWSFNTVTDKVTAMNLSMTNNPFAVFNLTSPTTATFSNGNTPNSWQVGVWGSPGPGGYSGDNSILMYFDFDATTGALMGPNPNKTNNYTSLNYTGPGSNGTVVNLASAGTYSITGIQPVPEPGSAALMLSGLGMVVTVARRRRLSDDGTLNA